MFWLGRVLTVQKTIYVHKDHKIPLFLDTTYQSTMVMGSSYPYSWILHVLTILKEYVNPQSA